MPEASPAWEPLRIGSSQIGACVGVHPYAELDELFDGLIYQGAAGRALLARDAAAVGAVVETKDEEATRILAGASAATRRAFRAAERAATVDAATTGAVAAARAAAGRAVAAAVARREVSAAEGAALASYARHGAHTAFGRRQENDAIAAYERATGNAVRDGNNVRHELRFDASGAWTAAKRRERSRSRVNRAVRRFAESDDAARELPPWPAADRRAAHALADELGLGHASSGAGADRRVVLAKPPTGWHYLDSAREPRGPFYDDAMRAWIAAGWFGDDVLVARSGRCCACVSAVYRRLGDVRRGCGDARCRAAALFRPPAPACLAAYDGASSDSSDGDSDDDLPAGAAGELFRVVGYVDGLSDEVDVDDWTARPIVVEIKNRMASTRTPDLYDQLQIVAYCIMTGCAAGHLVQRVRSADDAPVRVDRVALADHEKDWRAVVVPRLVALAEAVLALRRDAPRRRAWLRSSPRDRWATAAALCDWLPLPPPEAPG